MTRENSRKDKEFTSGEFGIGIDFNRQNASRPNFEYKCLNCGRKFKNIQSVENAAVSGCPNCGSYDIDI